MALEDAVRERRTLPGLRNVRGEVTLDERLTVRGVRLVLSRELGAGLVSVDVLDGPREVLKIAAVHESVGSGAAIYARI